MKRAIIILAACFALTSAALGIPQLVNYQGFLTRPDGAALDTVVSMTFKLYDAASSGAQLWTETQPSCTVSAGLFNTVLGSVTSVPDSFNRAQVWLGVTVGNNSEMTPRIQFTAVPYAYRIATVDGAIGGVISGKLNVGTGNTNPGAYAMVAGLNNHADGNYSVISGGGGMNPLEGNSAGYYSFIGGGRANIAGENNCVVSGGFNNTASNVYATVGGGIDNTASGYLGATVAGGSWNEAIGQGTTVGGGRLGRARGAYAVVAGGGGVDLSDSNSAVGDGSTISGGSSNAAFGTHSVIGGGRYNLTRGNYSVVAGGGGISEADSNSATGVWSTIGGGRGNFASGEYSTIGGGRDNRAEDWSIPGYATVAGGHNNKARGLASTVPGGEDNNANGNYSFAAGYRANANAYGSFVWADASSTSYINNGTDNSFYARASGGFRFFTSSSMITGSYLAAGSGTWNSLSDSTKKRRYGTVNTKEILDKVATIPIERWSYKSQDENVHHIGPMAQDFWNAFHVGDDSLGISTIDPDGVALAAIQELAKQVNALKEENTILRSQVQTLMAEKQKAMKEEK